MRAEGVYVCCGLGETWSARLLRARTPTCDDNGAKEVGEVQERPTDRHSGQRGTESFPFGRTAVDARPRDC